MSTAARSGRDGLTAATALSLAVLLAGVVATARSQDGAAAARPPLMFPGYPDAPAFSVKPRRDEELFFFPCSQCHQFMDPNDDVRELFAPHDIPLEHGNGRFWCVQCHSLTERDSLNTLLGEPVHFDEAYIVCGGCHANRQKDWYFGAHGKRIGNWQGDRELVNCTHCHNPHSPKIKPRAPVAFPPVRAGLERQSGHIHVPPQVWEKDTSGTTKEQPGEQ